MPKGTSVQELIRDDIGKRPPGSLRTDETPSVPSELQSADTVPARFLKPSGVDAPSASSVNRPLTTRTQDAQHGAPPKKRGRDDSGDKDRKKRQKKKDKSSAARVID